MTTAYVPKRAFITVRTYPVPAWSGIEVSCTAAITDDGQWIRLFPIPYRFLTPDQRFKKFQWIEFRAQKATSDTRPESFRVDTDSIKVIPGSTIQRWDRRAKILMPLKAPSLCDLVARRDEHQFPTLGLFKPKEIKRLRIEKEPDPEWTEGELQRLRQIPMFAQSPKKELQKVPFKFLYEFKCDDARCTTHTISCTDWEMGWSYYKWRGKYGAEWEKYFRQTYERDMIERYDTHFFVGTVHGHPNRWIIVGLYRPPKTSQLALL